MAESDGNGHIPPIQWQNELVAYLSDGYVVVAIRGRHPDSLMPQNFVVGVLDSEQSKALGLLLQQLAQELKDNDPS